jgi:hypothetical protein
MKEVKNGQGTLWCVRRSQEIRWNPNNSEAPRARSLASKFYGTRSYDSSLGVLLEKMCYWDVTTGYSSLRAVARSLPSVPYIFSALA